MALCGDSGVYWSADKGKGRQSITLLLGVTKKTRIFYESYLLEPVSTIYAPLRSIILNTSIDCTVGSTYLEIRQSELRLQQRGMVKP